MAATEKSTLKTEAIFSEDKEHRFLLKKEWNKNKNKKKAMVIMINSSSADGVSIDYTTLYVINNLVKLDFGSVDMVNLFSKIDIRVSLKESFDDLIHEDNDGYILKSAAKADNIIIAWGKIGKQNKELQKRQRAIIDMLEEYKDKLYLIKDSSGRGGYHPLAPQVRFQWHLEPLGE
ncbi:MAG: DUF1643 domain-containing protein [Clostridiaceae bacterium]|nr:DUF1643 domain-containing protein [Clostridiaceae bacterium]